MTAFVPEFDDYLRPEEARERFRRSRRPRWSAFDGGKHLWVGDAERVLDEIVRRVAPAVAVPLPTDWDGPMETADTSAYNAHNLAAYKDVKVPGPAQRPAHGDAGEAGHAPG